MRTSLPELELYETILGRLGSRARVEVMDRVRYRGEELPLYGTVLGSSDPNVPTFGLVGGVHGLERIGSRVVLAWMHTLSELLDWDDLVVQALECTRLVFAPIVNPWGLLLRKRSNVSGVDLMRNAPPHEQGRGSLLVGGQRISPRLPWYMGEVGAPMQPEARALCDFIRKHVFPGRPSIVLDCHSGFGFKDRLWFPYARTRRPFPHLAEVYALNRLFDATLPNHVYRFEPQARNYTVRGDLWDYLHDQHQDSEHRDATFLPLTLEMGSWRWVKKNPRQILTALGGFNPVKPHRLRRTLRRHVQLFDFLYRATASSRRWLSEDPEVRESREAEAFRLWFSRS